MTTIRLTVRGDNRLPIGYVDIDGATAKSLVKLARDTPTAFSPPRVVIERDGNTIGSADIVSDSVSPGNLLLFLEQAGAGCISGSVSEWPQLKPACRWAAREITRLRSLGDRDNLRSDPVIVKALCKVELPCTDPSGKAMPSGRTWHLYPVPAQALLDAVHANLVPGLVVARTLAFTDAMVKRMEECDVLQAEVARLTKVINDTAACWVEGNPGVSWEGGLPEAMKAAMQEIVRLRTELEQRKNGPTGYSLEDLKFKIAALPEGGKLVEQLNGILGRCVDQRNAAKAELEQFKEGYAKNAADAVELGVKLDVANAEVERLKKDRARIGPFFVEQSNGLIGADEDDPIGTLMTYARSWNSDRQRLSDQIQHIRDTLA
jgi:hypothetical protein